MSDEPQYTLLDSHIAQQEHLSKRMSKLSGGGFWRAMPGLVYTAAVILLSTVLAFEISKLFATTGSIILQTLGWLSGVVVGLSGIAFYYGKADVFQSERQQKWGRIFWLIDVALLGIGLMVLVADTFSFAGVILDIARFVAFLAVVFVVIAWGTIAWQAPDTLVKRKENAATSQRAIMAAELEAGYQVSDDILKIQRAAAREKARRAAMASLPDGMVYEPLLSSGKYTPAPEDDDESGLTVGDVSAMSPEQFAALAAMLNQWQAVNQPAEATVKGNGQHPKA